MIDHKVSQSTDPMPLSPMDQTPVSPLKQNSSEPMIKPEVLHIHKEEPDSSGIMGAVIPTFSPQNMADKLLSSLGRRESKSNTSADMLIFDDIENTKEAQSQGNDQEEECFPMQPVIHVKTKPKEEIQKDKIVEELLAQIVNEVKESMFPLRETIEPMINVGGASA